jgi:hypothetical protein
MGNPMNGSARRAEPVLSAIAGRTGAITTYGIDGHREQDMENFVNDQSVVSKSIGQTTRIIEKRHPNLEFSNLARG